MKCPSCGAANLEGADECESCRLPLSRQVPDAERRILEGRVADLSPKAARTISPSRGVLEAIEAMRREKIGCLLVLDGQKLAGVLSERELVTGGQDFDKASVRDLMRPPAAAVLNEDDSVADAFHGMAVTGQRHLPIRLKAGGYGVVSARDLLRYLCA